MKRIGLSKIGIFLLAMMLVASVMIMNTTTLYAEDGGSGDAIEILIDEEHFPDDIFREYVRQSFDEDKNGKLSKYELEFSSSIWVDDMNIKSLKGIEYFTEMDTLFCRNNQLTELDVSKNLKLKYLICINNKIEKLNLSNSTEFVRLECDNNSLTTLDVSKNINLLELHCNNNKIASLDLSNNPELYRVLAHSNQLTTLDISKNTKLSDFMCYGNKLKFLELNDIVKESVREKDGEKLIDEDGLPLMLYRTYNTLIHTGIWFGVDQLTLTAKFDMNGHGVAPAEQSFETDLAALTLGVDKLKVNKPEDPTEEGWIFGGWYTDKGCTEGKEFNFDTLIKEDTTLYAKWTKENSEFVADDEENKADTDKKADKKNDTGAKKQSVRKATPVTEDTTNIFAIILLGIASLAGIVASLGLGKRREDR